MCVTLHNTYDFRSVSDWHEPECHNTSGIWGISVWSSAAHLMSYNFTVNLFSFHILIEEEELKQLTPMGHRSMSQTQTWNVVQAQEHFLQNI